MNMVITAPVAMFSSIDPALDFIVQRYRYISDIQRLHLHDALWTMRTLYAVFTSRQSNALARFAIDLRLKKKSGAWRFD